MKTYAIANWAKRYENNRTRDIKALHWVPVPNTHDGDGYTTLVCRENGAALLGAWLAILQVASKCEPRGTLLRDNGKPHDSESIARMTRLPVEIIAEALRVCSDECNWLEINAPQEGAVIPQAPAEIPQEGDYRREEKRTEEKEQKKSAADAALEEEIGFNESHPLNCLEFQEAWTDWTRHRREKKKPITALAAQKQLAELSEMGLDRALIAITFSIRNGYQGIFEPQGANRKAPDAAPDHSKDFWDGCDLPALKTL